MNIQKRSAPRVRFHCHCCAFPTSTSRVSASSREAQETVEGALLVNFYSLRLVRSGILAVTSEMNTKRILFLALCFWCPAFSFGGATVEGRVTLPVVATSGPGAG